MIVTATGNPALDVTYSVPGLAWNAARRVASVHRQAGGKGINVARALTAMGRDAVAVGLVGGSVGTLIRADLDAAGIRHDLVEGAGESRLTVVARGGDARSLELDEPGMVVSAKEWTSFSVRLGSHLGPGTVLALSGSLPEGVERDAYRLLIERSIHAGARVILDTSGPALAEALAAGPDVVKPNRAEIEKLVGRAGESLAGVVEGCRAMLDLGARAVVASLGAAGAVAVGPGEAVALTHPPRDGNAVGAGDALVAGMAAALDAGRTFFEAATQGVAWAYASLASPFAGWLDPDEVTMQQRAVKVTALPASRADDRGMKAVGR